MTSPACNGGAPPRSPSTSAAKSASSATSLPATSPSASADHPGDDLGPEWTRFPIARLHHTKTTGLWTLYWRDRNLKFHHYQPLDPSPRVQDLLDYLDKHADPIFWG